MLVSLLYVLYFIVLFFLIVFILIQTGKAGIASSHGASGQSQNVFGGAGGDAIFAKITWGLGFTFMAMSLFIAKIQTKHIGSSELVNYEMAIEDVENKEANAELAIEPEENSTAFYDQEETSQAEEVEDESDSTSDTD